MIEHPLTAFLRDPEGWPGWPWEYREITITYAVESDALRSPEALAAAFTLSPYPADGWDTAMVCQDMISWRPGQIRPRRELRVRLRRLKTPQKESEGAACVSTR